MTLSQAKPVAVNSSLLANVSYDAGQSVLQLELRDGAIYRYLDVPPVIYEGLLAAESKGSYFNREVRDCFRYARIRRSQ
jgi:hypothetical protein